MSDFFEIYKDRFQVAEAKIAAQPKKDTNIIVVIPCFSEPDIITSLAALNNCSKPDCAVETIVVINASEIAEATVLEQNRKTKQAVEEWAKSNELIFSIFIIEENSLPKKHAGVGLARKIGMDEAAFRFAQINKRQGIIACFDADCTCDSNYLRALEKHSQKNKNSGACSIYYEHPTSGNDYPQAIYDAIVKYETHLRYYKQALTFVGFPYAFHTVGSSMAVTAEIYCKAGGMNKRKAGEDFYFIQKLMPLTEYSEINTTRIVPSPRKSLRVPFGTGKAMIEITQNGNFKTYNFQCFRDLKVFFTEIEASYPFTKNDLAGIYRKLPESIQQFVEIQEFITNLNRCLSHSTNKEMFLKSFFQYFDAFRLLKFIHFCTESIYPKALLNEAVKDLYNISFKTERQLLEHLRKIDRNIL